MLRRASSNCGNDEHAWDSHSYSQRSAAAVEPDVAIRYDIADRPTDKPNAPLHIIVSSQY